MGEKPKVPRGFPGDFHKNGIPRVERYFACSICLDEKSLKHRFMLPYSESHNDFDYQFPCIVCGRLTKHHDIGHIPIKEGDI